MAWPEQTGIHSWRVRYRRGVGTESISGFSSEEAARSYISDMDTDRRRGTWINPPAATPPSPTGANAGSPASTSTRAPWSTTAATCAVISCRASAVSLSEPSPLSTSRPGSRTTSTPGTRRRPSPAGSSCCRWSSPTPSTNASSPATLSVSEGAADDAPAESSRRRSGLLPNRYFGSRIRPPRSAGASPGY